MRKKWIRERQKQVQAGILAILCFCMAVLPLFDMTSVVGRAATFSGPNIWSGGSEMLFGHKRNYLYRWSDGYQMTFCISPGKHMGVSVVSEAIRTTVDDMGIPYIKSPGDYELLADVCFWYDHHGADRADNATYAAAQTAIWAIMNDGWESAGALEAIVDRHVPGTLARWHELQAYVERTGGPGAEIPAWLKTSRRDARKEPHAMRQKDGVWKREFDISSVPQLAPCEWQFEGDAAGWSVQTSGGKLVFTCTDGQVSEMIVSTPVPDSLAQWEHNTETLNIYLPKGSTSILQAMISAGLPTSRFYLCLTGGEAAPEEENEVELTIYRHQETFSSHYQVGLEKLCAETGQPLAGARFQVLEAFDAAQTGGLLDPGSMTPRPAVWRDFKICGDEATDEEGHFIHGDRKSYEYEKTYCSGHPKPGASEEEEIPEERKAGAAEDKEMSEERKAGAADIEDDAEAAAEQQKRAERQWEALVEQCAAYNEGNHFHNVTPGAALEEMLADRDASYEQFIGLEYRYAFRETQARYGYVRHGQHRDDRSIPILRVSSLEAGGSVYEDGRSEEAVVNEDIGQRTYRPAAETKREPYRPAGTVRQAAKPGGGRDWGWKNRIRKEAGSGERKKDRTPSGKPAESDWPFKTATPANAEEAAEPGWDALAAATPSDAERSGKLRYLFLGRTGKGPAGDPEEEDILGEPALPEPVEDDVEWVTPRPYDTEPQYPAAVTDHRTEGELHINKRDMELSDGEGNGYDSYGDTQGDATLEGAVYGLYAAEDIIHPDGKTGVVYRAGELTAVAATDKNGDASFMAYTEEGALMDGAFGQSRSGRQPDSWIGRPLIAGRYLVKEIARSEGYELTVDPAAVKKAKAAGRADVTSAMSHPIDMHDGSWLEFEVTCRDTSEGFDILVSGFPEGSAFFRSGMEETSAEEEVVTGVRMVPTGEYERAKGGEYRLDATGSRIPKRDGDGSILYDEESPVMRTYFAVRRSSYYPGGEYEITVDPKKWRDTGAADGTYIREEVNAILEQLGYVKADPDSAPWTVLQLGGKTNQSLAREILEWYGSASFWSCAIIDRVWEEDGVWKALAFHDYPGGSAVYEAASDTVYVRVPVRVGGGKRHMYVPFPSGACVIRNGYVTLASVKQKDGEIPFGAVMEDYLEPEYAPLYERYAKGDYLLDGRGEPIPIYREEYILETRTNTTSDYALTPLDAVYDAAAGSYRIHVDNTVDWSRREEPLVMTFRASAPEKTRIHEGRQMFYSDYLTDIAGAGASAFACVRGDEPAGAAKLVYPGQISPVQDGTGVFGAGSRREPLRMGERIITQRVKVIKTVTAPDGTPAREQLPNFRFKAYLKSNLERLYRDENGAVVWLDRRGRAVDIAEKKRTYPAKVPGIFTKVPRQTAPLYKQNRDAVIAGEVLYRDGEDKPRDGYTAVLETVEKTLADGTGFRKMRVYNYDKFFDAMTVANYDKWDDGTARSTSYRPRGNTVNRSKAAVENEKASDMVRQFAIDWYLDGEAARMDTEGTTAYGDQLYDEALRRAIRKAENYLKPFFAYDLDEIYAIAWDGEAGGGPDGDPSTVSADDTAEGSCFGVSAGLPYGTYVIAEQQPHYAKLRDFRNRHYRTGSPKEVCVPSLYLQTEMEDPDDVLSAEYLYDSQMSMEEMQERYRIRFGEERPGPEADGAAAYVTEAGGHIGEYEIYQYGMDMDLISNGAGSAGKGDYFALTQDRWKPYPNYYNEADDRTAGEVTYYLSEGKPGSREAGQVYRYSSVTEDAANADGVRFAGGPVSAENPRGYYFRDHVKAMRGVRTAYEGLFSPALVPESPEEGVCARVRFANIPYRTRLRIEKLDSETRENLLHDDAIFNLYEAEREEAPDGEGRVRFYDADTTVKGSREFLESMRAADIRPLPGGGYQGVVSEGTPVCREKKRVFQTDERGVRTGEFRSYTTARDGALEKAGEDFAGGYGLQNAGWLETPEPLDAGAYVLAEAKAPDGYVRSRPVAVEIYSDTVTYYQRGDRDRRVVATIYGTDAEGAEGPEDTARIYVENEPVRLLAEKRKEAQADGGGGDGRPRTVTFRISGRVDAGLGEIGGSANYEYAFRNGVYLGYAWRKGTLEYLKALKDSGMDVRIVYHGGIFAGYGYVTQTLETADDRSGYVTGALMTLYEGMELTPSGDREDLAYEGLVVERGGTGNVTRMYVKKGYAGSRTEFVNTGRTSSEPPGDVWSAVRTERDDTDILFHDLGGLELFRTETVAGKRVLYAYGRDHSRLEVGQLEEDKELCPATDGSQSIFAFRNGAPVFELAGGDFKRISYSAADKVFEGAFARPKRRPDGTVGMSGGVALFHLAADGSRDSLTDPYTGMAYVLAESRPADGDDRGSAGMGFDMETLTGAENVRVLVWPVTVSRDKEGRLMAREKIATSRIATPGETADTEYLTGTWEPEDGGQSHQMSSLVKNRFGQDLNGEPVFAGNNGSFGKTVRPVYDRHGLPRYYRCSGQSYETEIPLYDRSGRPVREKTADLAGHYDEASYVMENGKILHRAGESYILENTWITGESTPDDPFSGHMTKGQADLLRRVPSGAYIMEELAAPEGYRKGLPTGVVVEETAAVQRTEMTDRTTKLLIGKIDGTESYSYQVLDMRRTDDSGRTAVLGTVTEGKGAFRHTQIPGARLTLYEASRVYTSDLERYPNGTYLKKKDGRPFRFHSTDSRPGAEEELTASWISGDRPVYLEGLPAGEYLLEETETPAGMVSAPAVEVTAGKTGQVQTYILYNDHTKVELEKYSGDGADRNLVNGAGFTIFEAVTDAQGQVVYDGNGWPAYDPQKAVDRFVSCDGEKYRGFIREFEEQFGRYGTGLRAVSWEYGGQNRTAYYVNHTQLDASEDGGSGTAFPTTVQMTLRTDSGEELRVTAYGQGESRLGQNWVYEYRLDYHALPEVNERASSYLTVDGMRRWDYLPAGAAYAAVETEPPAGYAAAEPVLLKIQDTADIQRYRVRNEEGAIMISKSFSGGGELSGARLRLYRAAADGSLVREDAYLAAEWISGQDGTYTEDDRLNGRIPAGYQEGDLRPHMLKRLPSGDYWLTEAESPDYYTTFRPVRIEYRSGDPIRIVRVSDVLAEGEVTVRKADPEGNALTGAVFEVSAYRQPDLKNPVFTRRFSDSGGAASLTGLPVGEAQEDGSVVPYCYRLREVVPPRGYAVNPQVYSFEFAPDRNGVSYQWGETAGHEQRITDRRTRIAIRKKDFGEAFVAGAELAVYPVAGTGENGAYLYDADAPFDRWITSEGEPDHVLEGLIAGQSYLLAELSAPEGYQIMPPAVFTLSEDGRRISSIGSHPAIITFHDLFSATVRGRYAVRSEVTAEDGDGNTAASWTASGDGHVLTAADGIRNGGIYTLTERTIYSDGSAEVTDRRTLRLSLEDGRCPVKDRRPVRVRLRLLEAEETQAPEPEPDRTARELAAYDPSEARPELIVGEPASEQELLSNRKTYVLAETTFYDDGSRIESGRLAFTIGDDGSVAAVAGYDQARRLTVSKRDITGEEELPGALLQILNEDGGVVEEWISDTKPHLVGAGLEPGRPYTLREVLPPKGWAYASEVTFTLSSEGSTEQVLMTDGPTRVSVTKTDITGEKELAGARMQILEAEGVQEGLPREDVRRGRLVEEWISTGEAHEIVGKLEAGKTYILHEESAPAGYAYAADIVFQVSEDGRIDRVVMKDEALPQRPAGPRTYGKPAAVKPGPRLPGTVEAEYQVYRFGVGAVPLGSPQLFTAPATGDADAGAAMGALVLAVCSAAACGIFGVLQRGNAPRRNKPHRNKPCRRGKAMFAVSAGLAAAMALTAPAVTARAEEQVTETAEDEIMVRFSASPAAGGEGQEPAPPPDIYVWQDEEYDLSSYQLTEVLMPELVRQVRESVRYESVERAAGVPAEIETEIRDEATGRRASVMLPLESEEASGWRWEGGFTFPVTVWGYDSGSFLLGGETVEVREDQPFAGYESALLELIGVDPEYYRIDSVEWSGPPENGENGQIRRQAAASGQKYVADIEAVYGGPAVIPAQPGTAYEAVYRRRMSETETEDPTEPETEAPKHETEASAASVPADPTQEEPEVLWWLRNLRYATTVIIGLGVLAGLPAVLMFFRRRKRRKENENRRKV